VGIFKHRPKAKFKLGQLVRGETFGGRAQGYVIYSEYDHEDRRHYTWEEWEITGFNDYDSWVEYDHYTRKITAYEPFKIDANLDPHTVTAGTSIQAPINGQTENLYVKEVGTAKVVRREGTLTHHVFENEPLSYAEITFSSGVLSVEKYNEREYDVYKGRVLTVKEQKKMFGRRVQPLNLAPVILFTIFGGFGLFAIYQSTQPSYETYCTPRTLVNSSSTSSDQVVSQDENQTCYRRAVYGGGGGGLGK
jgi:hypothetical protein